MTVMTHHTNPFPIAQALDKVSTTALLVIGTVVDTNDGGTAMYCQALSGVAQYNGVVIAEDFTCRSLATANVANSTGDSKQVGWAQTSCPSGSYCWIQTSGRPIGEVAANVGDKITLYTTATAGILDDATITQAMVAGVVMKAGATSVSNATARTLIVPTRAFIAPHGQ
mgnify:CR=1 FL=1